jgi:hypothetical protein
MISVTLCSNIQDAWPKVKNILSDTLKKTGWNERYPLHYLHSDLVNDELQCWIIEEYQEIKGVAVTQIIEYPLGKSLFIFQLGGSNMADWYKKLQECFVVYADLKGAKWIDASARPGMGKKYLNGLGYKIQNYHYSCGVA